MSEPQEPSPNHHRLEMARGAVQSFLYRKKRWVSALFVVAFVCEFTFLILLFAFMDFASRRDWFMLFGFLFVYTPLVALCWRNAIKIDHLYYRLVDTLKYEEEEP